MTDTIGTNEFEKIQSPPASEGGMVELAVIPMPGVAVYPGVIIPVTLDDTHALSAARSAIDTRRTILTVMTPDDPAEVDPQSFVGAIGTEAALGKMLTLLDGHTSALAQGRRRVKVEEILQTTPHVIVRAREMPDHYGDPEEVDGLYQSVIDLFLQSVDLNETLPDEVVDYALSIENPGWFSYFVATILSLSTEERHEVLKTVDLIARLRLIASFLSRELDVLELKDQISGQIQAEIARNQREMYLREQMRAIQTELGEEDIFQQEMNDLRQQIVSAEMPVEVLDRANKELARLGMMPPMAPEVTIVRTYIDWLVTLPWSKASEDNLDLQRAQSILDREHYGLPRIKDRILEHIAVRKLAADKMKSPILCFVGPPGVGKTSLGRSIAAALGREFVRVSLGGIHDEAEIRGHRRTYIGAMPGRIVQTLRRAGTVNPVFMLDEIDKLGADFRGDPSAALLEVLDPEQNREFSDHYLDVPYDLSKVMFITTANDLYPIPPALLDRMEIIEFPGYTEEDKLDIAREFLIPKQLEAHGLTESGIKFTTEALQTIIRDYTYEAGVRNFEREIANACRKISRLIAEEKRYPRRLTAEIVIKYLGPPEHLPMRANQEDSVGVATGMAWTAGGGDILTIEVTVLPGKGTMMLTGQLGDVMQESAQAAMSYLRSRADDFDIQPEEFENCDIHIHLPEGAVPKEGPSAGITLAAAIISAFTERKVRADVAMTGEITLHGKVLPVGGVKEKVLAARRAKITRIILPEPNRRDLVDIPPRALRGLNLIFVDNMQQVIDTVLVEPDPDRVRRSRVPTDTEAEDDSDE